MTKPAITAKTLQDGVAEAVADWMATHDVTTTYAIQDGIKAAVADWLKIHGERVIGTAIENHLHDYGFHQKGQS